ncbi:hypothetical protein BCR34DRAFT_582240 [Clohesyomyces aquaticus]|uniref:Uncharacterized protein n=1 Tax=Clohesyomyces aquaticus TaxID=1231657 RepID=A0A1Y2AB66_9PLEO|nr:hypothetical protein BCR34DRAFT_582240 [Clohesyomyces aquaticus]
MSSYPMSSDDATRARKGFKARPGRTAFESIITKKLYNDPEDSDEERQRLRSERDEFRSETEFLKKEIASLQIRVGEEQEKNSRFKHLADRIHSQMENKELFLSEQVTDETVKQNIEELMDSIRNWATLLGDEFSTTGEYRVDQKLLADYQRVSPAMWTVADVRRIWSNKKYRKFFIRGWVSLIICDTIFRSAPFKGKSPGKGEDFWIEESTLRGTFNKLEDLIYSKDSELSHRELNDWRALTIELITKLGKHEHEEEEEEPGAERKCETPFDELLDRLPAWVDDRSKEELLCILGEAVKLSRVLRQQRACWTVRFLPHYYCRNEEGKLVKKARTFAPDLMVADYVKDDSGPPPMKGHALLFVLTPLVCKRGDIRGENFDSEEVKQKAAVVLNTPTGN